MQPSFYGSFLLFYVREKLVQYKYENKNVNMSNVLSKVREKTLGTRLQAMYEID